MKIAVLLICSGIGYLLGHYLPDPWSTYASILISYHLYLAWLVITAEHEAGFSLPVLPTILGHGACLVVLVGLAIGRRYVPFLGIVRLFVPALAPFETKWLFKSTASRYAVAEETSGGEAVSSSTPSATEDPGSAPKAASTPPAVPQMEYTADDDNAWRAYLATPRREFRKPGTSVGDELKQWLAARALSKAAQVQSQQTD